MAMLVGAQYNKVTPRPVTTVGSQGSNWIVTEGLNPGDKVIVDGIAKVKPEQQVYQNLINLKLLRHKVLHDATACSEQKKADDAKEKT